MYYLTKESSNEINPVYCADSGEQSIHTSLERVCLEETIEYGGKEPQVLCKENSAFPATQTLEALRILLEFVC